MFFFVFVLGARTERTDRQTDKRTDGRVRPVIRPSSMHKSSDEMLVTTDKVQVLEADKNVQNVQIKTRQMSPLN